MMEDSLEDDLTDEIEYKLYNRPSYYVDQNNQLIMYEIAQVRYSYQLDKKKIIRKKTKILKDKLTFDCENVLRFKERFNDMEYLNIQAKKIDEEDVTVPVPLSRLIESMMPVVRSAALGDVRIDFNRHQYLSLLLRSKSINTVFQVLVTLRNILKARQMGPFYQLTELTRNVIYTLLEHRHCATMRLSAVILKTISRYDFIEDCVAETQDYGMLQRVVDFVTGNYPIRDIITRYLLTKSLVEFTTGSIGAVNILIYRINLDDLFSLIEAYHSENINIDLLKLFYNLLMHPLGGKKVICLKDFDIITLLQLFLDRSKPSQEWAFLLLEGLLRITQDTGLHKMFIESEGASLLIHTIFEGGMRPTLAVEGLQLLNHLADCNEALRSVADVIFRSIVPYTRKTRFNDNYNRGISLISKITNDYRHSKLLPNFCTVLLKSVIENNISRKESATYGLYRVTKDRPELKYRIERRDVFPLEALMTVLLNHETTYSIRVAASAAISALAAISKQAKLWIAQVDGWMEQILDTDLEKIPPEALCYVLKIIYELSKNVELRSVFVSSFLIERLLTVVRSDVEDISKMYAIYALVFLANSNNEMVEDAFNAVDIPEILSHIMNEGFFLTKYLCIGIANFIITLTSKYKHFANNLLLFGIVEWITGSIDCYRPKEDEEIYTFALETLMHGVPSYKFACIDHIGVSDKASTGFYASRRNANIPTELPFLQQVLNLEISPRIPVYTVNKNVGNYEYLNDRRLSLEKKIVRSFITPPLHPALYDDSIFYNNKTSTSMESRELSLVLSLTRSEDKVSASPKNVSNRSASPSISMIFEKPYYASQTDTSSINSKTPEEIPPSTLFLPSHKLYSTPAPASPDYSDNTDRQRSDSKDSYLMSVMSSLLSLKQPLDAVILQILDPALQESIASDRLNREDSAEYVSEISSCILANVASEITSTVILPDVIFRLLNEPRSHYNKEEIRRRLLEQKKKKEKRKKNQNRDPKISSSPGKRSSIGNKRRVIIIPTEKRHDLSGMTSEDEGRKPAKSDSGKNVFSEHRARHSDDSSLDSVRPRRALMLPTLQELYIETFIKPLNLKQEIQKLLKEISNSSSSSEKISDAEKKNELKPRKKSDFVEFSQPPEQQPPSTFKKKSKKKISFTLMEVGSTLVKKMTNSLLEHINKSFSDSEESSQSGYEGRRHERKEWNYDIINYNELMPDQDLLDLLNEITELFQNEVHNSLYKDVKEIYLMATTIIAEKVCKQISPSNLSSEHVVRLHLLGLREIYGTYMLPLGRLKFGQSFERALLFKVAADHICIPCELYRSTLGTGYVQIVLSPEAPETSSKYMKNKFIVDLNLNPGTLYFKDEGLTYLNSLLPSSPYA